MCCKQPSAEAEHSYGGLLTPHTLEGSKKVESTENQQKSGGYSANATNGKGATT